MTEREKVLYDVAKLLYAAAFAEDDEVSPRGAWDAAEKFYQEMVARLGEPPAEVGERTK
jgi:hypothetical protein